MRSWTREENSQTLKNDPYGHITFIKIMDYIAHAAVHHAS